MRTRANAVPNAKPTAIDLLRSKNPVLAFEGKLRLPDEPFVPSDAQRRDNVEESVFIDAASFSPASVSIAGYFEGIDDTGWQPASPSIAVGTGHVLMATSDAFAVYDKCGNYQYGGVFSDYFGLSSDFLYYDPKVLYDDWHGRYVMVYQANDFTHQTSLFVVCISASGNLADGWGGYYFITDPSPTDFLDNTYIAVDPEGLYISYNGFDYATYAYEGAMIIVMNKEEIYDFGPTTYFLWYGLYNPSDASLALGVRPARMRSYDGHMYFLNNKYAGADFFTMWTLTDPFGVTPSLWSASINTSTYEMPPNMRQPDGSYVDVGDCRITDLIYDHGGLQAAFTRLLTSSGDWSRVSLWKFDVASASFSTGANFYTTQGYLSYGSIDIDEFGRTCLTVAKCSYALPNYLSLYFFIYDLNGSGSLGGSTFAFGLADYTLGGAGTIGNPYRWGNYTGCQIDPVDDRTFWCAGAYAHNDPVPSWSTRIAATTAFDQSALDVLPGARSAGGPPGGPFSPNLFTYTLENSGDVNLNWNLGNVPYWLIASDTTGVIPPYGSQHVMLVFSDDVEYFPAGTYAADMRFENCTGSGSASVPFALYVEETLTCPGALIELEPQEVGAFIDAEQCTLNVFLRPLKDIDVCAIGIQSFSTDPKVITGRVYESNGFSRQTMIGSVSQAAVQKIETSRLVPMDLTLEACRDYEIELLLPGDMTYLFFNEADFTYPFDVGGAIRVTQGGSAGDYYGTRLPAITVYGYNHCNPAITNETDLRAPGTPEVAFEGQRGSGLFITSNENMELCSVEFEADLPVGSHLQAWLWTASGNVRNEFVAEGHIHVGMSGMAFHAIPLHALLEYGQDYNIEVLFWDGGNYKYVDESAISLPFTTSDGAIEVRKGSFWGIESTQLPHIWLNWSDFASGGAPFDLAKTSGGVPPPYTSTNNLDHGAFVTTPITQQVFGMGVKADLPLGSILFARIYSTLPMGGRNLLLSEGWIYTTKEGMQWHDVPLAYQIRIDKTYDFSVVCSTVNEFGYWDDTSGMPYSPYGLYLVEDAEIGGSPSGTELTHMRLHACDRLATAVEEEAPSFARLYLGPPVPNPSGENVRLRYNIDKAGKADMVLYDVLGRRVATVFSNRTVPAGPGVVEFNTNGLASGVYFIKLTVPGRAGISQKMVIRR